MKHDLLQRYMDDLGEHAHVFTAAEEQDAARAIARARVARWEALLSYSPLFRPLWSIVESRLSIGGDPRLVVDVEALRESAAIHRGQRTHATTRAYADDLARVAARLPTLDQDSEVAELLMRDVERLAVGERPDWIVRLPRTRLFEDWIDRCRRAHAEVHQRTHRFARANLRLVVVLARRLGERHLPLEDLIQEGNLGLLKAVERFDPDRGTRFSTFAAWWIRHALNRALSNKARAIRVPVHVLEFQRAVSKFDRQFAAARGRPSTLEEKADALGVPVERLLKTLAVETSPLVSLDDLAAPGDERSLVELLEDEDDAPIDRLLSDEMLEGLERALARLEGMEQDILRRRFGLEGCRPETLNEIGSTHALSRERIRQLEVRALQRLRAHLRTMGLDDP